MTVNFRKISLLFICLITSCSNYNKVVDEEEIHREIEAIEITQPAKQILVHEGDQVNKKWWEVFEDDQLTSFINVSLKENLAFLDVQERIEKVNQESFIFHNKLFSQKIALSDNSSSILDLGCFISLDLNFAHEFSVLESKIGKGFLNQIVDLQAKRLLTVAIAHKYFALKTKTLRRQIIQELLLNQQQLLRLIDLRREHRINDLIKYRKIKEQIESLRQQAHFLQKEIELEKSSLMILTGMNTFSRFPQIVFWQLEEKNCKVQKKSDKCFLGESYQIKLLNEKIDAQKIETACLKTSYDLVYLRSKYGIDSGLCVCQANEKYLQARLEQVKLQNEYQNAQLDVFRKTISSHK